MKKVLPLILSAILLTSCSPKDEASDLYHRIMGFFKDNEEVATVILDDDSKSDVAINVEENADETVRVNITDKNQQVLDVNLDKETYEEYDYLIASAKDYVANNDVDVNRLMNDKAYMARHGLNFARIYGIDLNSLSAEDINKLQNAIR